MNKQNRFNKMWMDVAEIFAKQSHAVRLKVGCVIVQKDRIISQGWNGTSPGLDNSCEGEDGRTLPYVIHAESNAITKIARDGGSGTAGASLYITHAPCIDCAKLIVQTGINRVFYRDAYRSADGTDYLSRSNVEVTQLQT